MKKFLKIGKNGMVYADKALCESALHVSLKNDKVGNVLNFSLPIEYSCRKDCECYSKGNCYGCHGCYVFSNVQKSYTENLNLFLSLSSEDFVTEVLHEISRHKKYKIFRWFNVGDLLNVRMFNCICAIADARKDIKFYFYTKKYDIVNTAVDLFGGRKYLPTNLTIVFSHWLNDDGTYLDMENPYNFPTSEFIPYGQEHLVEKVNHICPCSNPNIKATCETCEHPCYSLMYGESMGLLEHSTKRTKKRDKEIKKAKNLL